MAEDQKALLRGKVRLTTASVLLRNILFYSTASQYESSSLKYIFLKKNDFKYVNIFKCHLASFLPSLLPSLMKYFMSLSVLSVLTCQDQYCFSYLLFVSSIITQVTTSSLQKRNPMSLTSSSFCLHINT